MTLTDIANIVLEDLGQRAISSLDGNEFDAVRIRRRINMTIDEVASMRKWTRLRRKVKLVCSEYNQDTGEGKFLLPNGLNQIIFGNPSFERLEGKFIVAYSPELELYCTIVSYDPNDWDANFRGAVIAQLGADLAMLVTKNPQIAQQKIQMARINVSRFIANDIYAEKERVVQDGVSWWIQDN